MACTNFLLFLHFFGPIRKKSVRATQLRKEFGKDTWLVFVDLVKAFDSVPRDGLFKILEKIGVPEHLLIIIKDLQKDFFVKLKVGEDDIEIPSTVGVKQGDNLAPVLFLFAIQACMETLPQVWPCKSKCQFMFNDDNKLMSRKHWDDGNLFEFIMSLYADDAAFAFETRNDMIAGTTVVNSHMKRFGLTMHVGRDVPAHQ